MKNYILEAAAKKQLILQPRMGFSSLEKMHKGLGSVKNFKSFTLGTITLDSYTRQNQLLKAQKAIVNQEPLNGFPLLNYPSEQITAMLEELTQCGFQVQVRHGTPLPSRLFKSMAQLGLIITEGGPVSYCLPYSQVPLKKSFEDWKVACKALLENPKQLTPHLESFAGCMLGQLAPPSILIALNILEALFFKTLGISSVSLSYAQGTSNQQDLMAIKVLQQCAKRYLTEMDWHCVFYTYMGMFPKTPAGAKQLIEDSAELAMRANCQRLIIKTKSEALRIPTIKDNIEALNFAYEGSQKNTFPLEYDEAEFEKILTESEALINSVLNLNSDISKAISFAFEKGLLGIPYCLHPENDRSITAMIDSNGYLCWINPGKMKIPQEHYKKNNPLSAHELIQQLAYMQMKYDTQ